MSALSSLFNLCLSIAKKEEEERADRKKKEKAANAVLKSSSRLLKELGERLIEIERQELEEEKQEGQKEKGESCSHYGRKGHEESMRQFCTEAVRKWKKKIQLIKRQDGRGSAAESKPSQGSSLEPEASTKKVSVIGIKDQPALHTPV